MKEPEIIIEPSIEELIGVSQLTENPEKDRKNKELCYRIQRGEKDAAAELCRFNHGFVVDVARKSLGALGSRAEFDDVKQEAFIGLLEAAKRMDVTSNISFLTYAWWWVFQKSIRAVRNMGYAVHIPDYKIQTIKKLLKTEESLAHLSQRERITEQSIILGIPKKEVEFLYVTISRFMNVTSTDKPLDTDLATLGDFVLKSEEPMPEEIVERDFLKKTLKEALSTLTPRERTVIYKRFGFEDGSEKTLEDVGKDLGVTRERVRQIEAKALRKLRHPYRSCGLKDFLS